LFGLRRGGLSRKKLLRHDGAIKLGDASPTGVLRKRLHTKDRLVHLEHPRFAEEMRRLHGAAMADGDHPLRLFTIRESRSQNSWLHNIPRLMSGKRSCRLRIHPHDADTGALPMARPSASILVGE